ncbi:MAG: hypothetical protein II957_00895 [Treponema sp.]|nr:hypothetical protein [Treponema sp.]
MGANKKQEGREYSPNWGGARSNSGGLRKGSGRKPLCEGGRQQLAISCSKTQKEAIQKAASDAGMTTAAYVLEKCGVSTL